MKQPILKIILLILGLVFICMTTPACKKEDLSVSTVTEQSVRQVPPKRDSSCSPPLSWSERLKGRAFIMDNPRITPICVEIMGPAKTLKLNFSIPENSYGLINPPPIHRIAIHDGTHWNCIISIADLSKIMAMSEWAYGDTPIGYQRYGCNQLKPGEYVIHAVSGPTEGVARFKVTKNDLIESLPLDDPAVLMETERQLLEDSP